MRKLDAYDRWFEKYKPIKNHLNDNAAFEGILYETYGDEVEYVRTYGVTFPNRIWTLVEEDGEMAILSGYHHVNRLGYFITQRSHRDSSTTVIQIDND